MLQVVPVLHVTCSRCYDTLTLSVSYIKNILFPYILILKCVYLNAERYINLKINLKEHSNKVLKKRILIKSINVKNSYIVTIVKIIAQEHFRIKNCKDLKNGKFHRKDLTKKVNISNKKQLSIIRQIEKDV